MQAVPAGFCSALRDAQAYQVRLEQQGQVYRGVLGPFPFCIWEIVLLLFIWAFPEAVWRQKYPQGVLPPGPDGKDCRGFGAFRHFCRPLP